MKTNWIKKMTALALAAAFCISSLQAQDNNTMMKDGVMMKDGHMMMMKDGKSSMMTEDMTMSNGTKVMMDGKVMKSDGNSMMMKDGQMMNMEGKMMDEMHK